MPERRPMVQFRADPLTLARLKVLERFVVSNRTAIIQLGLACLVHEKGLETEVQREMGDGLHSPQAD